ncbi:MAG: terminase large subunit [Brevundimonas mediterranea]|uniref:terminase large subunit n=1 Tax=Brevundimonas mediterranea TaxID=74329 RepID=UPI0040332560
MLGAVAVLRNPSRADRVIAFMNALPLVDGEAMGQRFKVDPWLESWIRDIYEPQHPDGRRIVRRAALSVARKNAKSYAVAGMLLAHLIGPEAITNGQIYSAATTREQAAVIFEMCRKMISETPALGRVLRVFSNKRIEVKKGFKGTARGSVYRALSADVAAQHGLGAAFFVFDEFGEARNDELWNVLLDSQQAVASPLAVAISTQNNNPNHGFSMLVDDGLKKEDPTIVVHLHAAPEGCDLMDQSAWLAANPALGTWKRPDAIATAAGEAVRNPAKEQNFRRRYLNQRVAMTSSLISRTDWLACLPNGAPLPLTATFTDAEDFEPDEEIYLALDMSLRTDLTALIAVSATGTLVKTWCWKPADLVDEHGKRDREHYDVWAKQGWLQTTPGRSIGAEYVAEMIKTIHARNPVKGLAYDRAYTEELLKRMDEKGLIAQEGEGSGLRIVPWGQGFVSMGKAVNAFEHAVLQGELRSDGNPLLTMAITNAVVDTDPAGNRKFMKNKVVQRIDPAVALAMALGLRAQDRLSNVTSAFEDEDFNIEAF